MLSEDSETRALRLRVRRLTTGRDTHRACKQISSLQKCKYDGQCHDDYRDERQWRDLDFNEIRLLPMLVLSNTNSNQIDPMLTYCKTYHVKNKPRSCYTYDATNSKVLYKPELREYLERAFGFDHGNRLLGYRSLPWSG